MQMTNTPIIKRAGMTLAGSSAFVSAVKKPAPKAAADNSPKTAFGITGKGKTIVATSEKIKV